MRLITSIQYPTRELAEFAATQLVLNGIAPTYITIRDQSQQEGLNLGKGLLPKLINAGAAEQDGYPDSGTFSGGFVVEVQSHGGDLTEAISRHIFGYLA